ncbi:hypothetical protein GYB22_12540 [bacterium]|nr:hypothetical protein [bacterium]
MAFILLSSYGILIEFIQGTAWINRSFEWADVLADALGVFLGIVLLPWCMRKLPLAKKYIPILNRFF